MSLVADILQFLAAAAIAAAGIAFVLLGCAILEHRRRGAHILAGLTFAAAGLLLMVPVLLP